MTKTSGPERLSIFRDQPNSVKTLKKTYKNRSAWPQLDALLAELKGESDRAAIILISALVEDALAMAIAKKFCFEPDEDEFNKCFRFEGPMGSFSSKIEIACVFGIIDDNLTQQLTIIREMRNACAHSKHALTFADSELANVAARLGPPIGQLNPDFSSQTSRKLSFISESLFIFIALSLGNREAARRLIEETLKKTSASSP